MNAKRKIEIGNVYSAKVGGSWLAVKIEKSLGHGRYDGSALPSGHKVKISTDAIRGDGQTLEAWKASTTPKEHDLPAPAPGETVKAPRGKKERTPKGPRQSLTNAAILILADAAEPMNAKAIVDKASADGLYKPGDGKTPEATLYSAMLRDKKTRFQKADRVF
ncbi:MAG: HTH domain-containing protein [Phycisphaerae bacterium]